MIALAAGILFVTSCLFTISLKDKLLAQEYEEFQNFQVRFVVQRAFEFTAKRTLIGYHFV